MKCCTIHWNINNCCIVNSVANCLVSCRVCWLYWCGITKNFDAMSIGFVGNRWQCGNISIYSRDILDSSGLDNFTFSTHLSGKLSSYLSSDQSISIIFTIELQVFFRNFVWHIARALNFHHLMSVRGQLNSQVHPRCCCHQTAAFPKQLTTTDSRVTPAICFQLLWQSFQLLSGDGSATFERLKFHIVIDSALNLAFILSLDQLL